MAAANVLKGGGVLLVSCRNHAGNVLSTSSSVPFRTGVKTEGSKRGMFWRHLSFCAVTTSSSTPAPPPPPPPADASSPPPPLSSDDGDPIKDAASMLDIRVGLVLKAWRHEEADSLYVEEVDVGEPEPRIICSGLVKYVPLDHLQDKKVVVLANLKPRNMRGVKSCGMLMAASDASHENVELLVPPEGSIPGERIWFGSEDEKQSQPAAASPNQAISVFIMSGEYFIVRFNGKNYLSWEF